MVFYIDTFFGSGSDASIRKAFSLLKKQNMIRRLAQGVYEYPKMHDVLGLIPPDLNEVAKAIGVVEVKRDL
jgi:hypothetical protein